MEIKKSSNVPKTLIVSRSEWIFYNLAGEPDAKNLNITQMSEYHIAIIIIWQIRQSIINPPFYSPTIYSMRYFDFFL